MYAHQRQIDRHFYPSQHPFNIILISILVARPEESSSIVCPPGDACCLHAQACDNLPAERFPVIAYIATPQSRTVALDAGESAARQYHGRLASSDKPLIDGFVDQQRIDVPYLLTAPLPFVYTASYEVVVFGLRSILPPGVNTQGHESLVELLPVGLGSIFVEEVYPVCSGNVVPFCFHHPSYL